MSMEFADLKSNKVARDSSLTWRLFDAWGPNVVKWIDDFVGIPVDDTTGYPVAYATTVVDAGTGTTTTVATDVAGGGLLITTAANDNDGAQVQLVGENFQLNGRFPCYFGTKLQISDVTQSDFIAGLCITDTTLLGGLSDGAYFRSVDAAATVQFILEKDSVETSVGSVATMTDATDITLEFYWDGDTITAYVDGVEAASAATTDTNFPNNELLTPSLAFLNGAAGAETLQAAYIRAIQVRN